MFSFYTLILCLECFEKSSHELLTENLTLNFRKVMRKIKWQSSCRLKYLKTLVCLIANLFFLYPKPKFYLSTLWYTASLPPPCPSSSSPALCETNDGFDHNSPIQMSKYTLIHTFYCKYLQVCVTILNTPSINHCWGCISSTFSLKQIMENETCSNSSLQENTAKPLCISCSQLARG